jgi:hypothetical protein
MEGKEELVSYKVAKLAKEKGFNWNVLDTFDDKENPVSRYNVDVDGLDSYINTGDENYVKEVFELNNSQMQSGFVARPTQSLLQKWLREEHKISIIIDDCFIKHDFIDETKLVFDYTLSSLGKQNYKFSKTFNSYEEALESGLKKALKML